MAVKYILDNYADLTHFRTSRTICGMAEGLSNIVTHTGVTPVSLTAAVAQTVLMQQRVRLKLHVPVDVHPRS